MIVVVEPHADDAFLSVGGLIEGWVKIGQSVGIITVYSGTRKRANDAKAYAEAVGARWHGMGGVEYGSMKEGDPAGTFPEGGDATVAWTHIIGRPEVTAILLPLGIGGHPEHIAVRDKFHDTLVVPVPFPSVPDQITRSGAQILYYVDQPYASKLKAQEEVDDTLTGRKIFAIHRPGARKFRHAGLFKDQAKFFYYNKPEDLEWRTFELVVY